MPRRECGLGGELGHANDRFKRKISQRRAKSFTIAALVDRGLQRAYTGSIAGGLGTLTSTNKATLRFSRQPKTELRPFL